MTAAPEMLHDERLTFEEFAALTLEYPADLVEGKIVEMPRNNPTHAEVVNELGFHLRNFVRPKKLGKVYAGDVAVITKRDPDSGRGADLAFASHERLKSQPANAAALEIAPELVIEVISPSNSWDHVMEKLAEYLAIGVREVWIITPKSRTAQVYRAMEDITGYSEAEKPIIEPNGFLEGFQLNLREVFEGIGGFPHNECK